MRRKRSTELPWVALGMSRATWYRLGKPGKKPRQETQAQIAHQFAVSVRGLQRAKRIQREAPDLAAQVWAGTLKLGPAERILVQRQAEAMLPWLRAMASDIQAEALANPVD